LLLGSLTKAAEEGAAAAAEWSDEAVIYVNGVRRVLPDGLAHLTLLQYLRGRSPSSFLLSSLYTCMYAYIRSMSGVSFLNREIDVRSFRGVRCVTLAIEKKT
jgi:hypothetical protein